MVTLLALPLLLAVGASAQRANSCVNGSSLLVGASATEAIAFTAACVARPLAVDTATLTLNASRLELLRVRSLPRLLALDLSDNALESLQLGGDVDLARLDLRANRFTDLSLSAFPPRLTYLDLRQNRIVTLAATGPWPQNAVLQTLLLDENPLAAVDAAALAPLRSLQFLSLARTSLTTLDGLQLPPSLSVLNVSTNALDSNSTSFSNLPAAIQYLDLSKNKLTRLPSRISELEALVELSLASNQITTINSLRLPKTLQKLDLNGNGIEMIELCRPDVSVFAELELTVPAFTLSACPNTNAAIEVVNGTPVCVVEDCANLSGATAVVTQAPPAPTLSPTPTAAPTAPPNDDDGASVLNNNRESSSGESSAFSSKAIVVIGGISFFIGVVMSAFAFILYRKRRLAESGTGKHVRLHYLSFLHDTRGDPNDNMDEKSDSNWVFGDPPSAFPHAVALLEEEDDRAKRRSKPGLLDDLLVYEIPPEEIRMKGDVEATVEARPHHPLLLAEYQGYQVVLHASLVPSKHKRQRQHHRRDERRFIEQIRLASVLDHPSLVQFIGLTFGASSHHSHRTSPYEPVLVSTQRWQFAVVFEFMHRGSLAAMFRRERGRRDGQLYYHRTGNDTTDSTGGGGDSLLNWFPTQHQPESDWRCKLSIALDVAMALVYLHANHVAHGCLSAATILVNETGEAKLSALDVTLPSDLDVATATTTTTTGLRGDASMRQSTRAKVRKLMAFKASSFSQSQLGSSFLHGGGGVPTAPVTPTRMSSRVPMSPTFRTTMRDIYAFGLLLWELDTLLSVDTMMTSTATPTTAQTQFNEHANLRFTAECPREIEQLARRCWSPEFDDRPDALELQEELVQLLEGRITTSSRAVSSWLRTTNFGSLRGFSSSAQRSASSSLSSASVYRLSDFAADV